MHHLPKALQFRGPNRLIKDSSSKNKTRHRKQLDKYMDNHGFTVEGSKVNEVIIDLLISIAASQKAIIQILLEKQSNNLPAKSSQYFAG